MPKTLVLYAYYHTPSTYTNMLFFMKNGIVPGVDYIMILNGDGWEPSIPLSGVSVVRRPNTGFDFGAYGSVLTPELVERYDYFVCMNASVIGPLWSSSDHPADWTTVFTSMLSDDVALVGTSIVCLPESDAGGPGPRVEGFIWCTDRRGMRLLMASPCVFSEHRTKTDAILRGEYEISKIMLSHGLNLGCLLGRYKGIDWRLPENHRMNGCIHPSRLGSYFGGTIDPYEVVFHKWRWHGLPNVLYDEVILPHIRATNREQYVGPTFDPSAYRSRYPDLAALNDEQAREHFWTLGFLEGRTTLQ